MHRPPLLGAGRAAAGIGIFTGYRAYHLEGWHAVQNDPASFSNWSKRTRPFNALHHSQNKPRFVVSAWQVRSERLRLLGPPRLRSGKCLEQAPPGRPDKSPNERGAFTPEAPMLRPFRTSP